jgi:hypothetical protein
MKKHLLIFFISFSFSMAADAQKLNVEVMYVTTDATATIPLIFYDPAIKLTWNDFKGKPVAASEAAAITNAGIGFKMLFQSKDNTATLKILVNCNFSIKDSWVKDGRKTTYILNHEQHHFDIAYIHAMQFIQNLKAAKYTMKDYSRTIEKIYYQCHTDLQTMQNAYDSETKNSQLANEQEQWNEKIDKQLEGITAR